jgi:hypothetical protein
MVSFRRLKSHDGPAKNQADRVPGDAVRDLLGRRVESLRSEALSNGGEVPAEDLDRVARLQRLLEIHAATHPAPAARRWPLAAAFGVTLMISSALLFLRVPETDVDLDLRLSEVTFVVPTPQMLTANVSLATLGASGLHGVQLPTRDGVGPERVASEGVPSAVRLSAEGRQGSVSLAPIVLPPGTRVWISQVQPAHYRLSIAAPAKTELGLRADVHGRVELGLPGSPATQLDFRSPRGIALESGLDQVDLDLRFPRLPATPFVSRIQIEGLRLSRVEELVSAGGTVVRSASTVLAGTLYFDSLAGQERKLRPGEPFAVERSRGEIRSLELREDGIGLRVLLRVQKMTVGAQDNRRSLMPTWLEWLHARHAVSLLWGTATYVFGLLLLVLRWWRIPV